MKFILILVFFSFRVFAAGISMSPAYLTGTWTPQIFLTTSQPTSVTYSSQVGTWYRIGSTVCGSFYVVLSAFTAGSGSGNAYVSGTPFAVDTTANGAGGGGGPLTYTATFTTAYPTVTQAVGVSHALALVSQPANNTSTLIPRANLGTTSAVGGTFCYPTNE